MSSVRHLYIYQNLYYNSLLAFIQHPLASRTLKVLFIHKHLCGGGGEWGGGGHAVFVEFITSTLYFTQASFEFIIFSSLFNTIITIIVIKCSYVYLKFNVMIVMFICIFIIIIIITNTTSTTTITTTTITTTTSTIIFIIIIIIIIILLLLLLLLLLLYFREVETTGYRYFLESPTSGTQRIEEDRMTYLNKGK